VGRYALIVAGGKGERFGGDRPKQFQDLGGTPLLVHTLQAFQDAMEWDELLLVLHPTMMADWERILEEYPLSMVPRTIAGGEERFHSVRNGVREIPEKEGSLVAVHDAVRPLVRPERIRNLMEEAELFGTAVPTVPLKESIRQVEGDGTNEAVDRSHYRVVQTPQCFRSNSLKAAMERPFNSEYTDEATVIEAHGEAIHLSEGDVENIKVTTPLDLRIAEGILKDR
jgi:2-C-methyl-D-erythritol 4-phosphate cytidylyltransferase